MKPDKDKIAIIERHDGVRKKLIDMGFRCLAIGKFGLPSYTDIQAWAYGATVVYLLLDTKHGGWDILRQIDDTNNAKKTWAGLDAMKGD